MLGLALLISSYAYAAAVSSTPVRVVYNCCNVTSSAWLAIVPSLIKTTKGVSLYNSGSVGIQVGIGPAGSEVAQLLVPPSATIAVVYPFVVGQSQAVSIKALASTGGTGELEANFIYN